MGRPLRAGSVVVAIFPFSDLRGYKRRPALVLAEAEFSNLILCQITTNPASSKRAVDLSSNNFSSGSLPIDSYIRPDKIFTIEQSLILYEAGSLQTIKMLEVRKKLAQIFELNKTP